MTRQLTPKPVPAPKKSSRTPAGVRTAAAAKKAAGERREGASRPAQPQVRQVKRKKKGGR